MAAPEKPNPAPGNGRRWLLWLNNLLAAGAVLALVVMANYIAAGHFLRFEMDRDSSFKLSDQTRRVLDGVTNDVNITIFFEPKGQDEEIYDLTAGLLDEYQRAYPRHIKVRTLDYDRDPGAAKEFLSTNGLSGSKQKDFVFFESNHHTKLVNARDLATYDFSELISGRSRYVRRSAFLGEVYFTGDIYDVTNPHQMKAYFLYGDGENDPEETQANSGYGKLAAILKDEVNCDWAKLNLQGTNTIPADCQMLIVPASAHEGLMTPGELAKISAYLKGGGRMLALLTVRSGLESVLAHWGVGVADTRIADMDKSFYLSQNTFLTAKINQEHPITVPLASEKMPLEMVFPRAVYPLEEHSKVPGAPEVTTLAATSAAGTTENGQIGPFSLLVAVEQGNIEGVNSPGGGGTRMVVAGDSDFLDNLVIDSVGNHSFARLALSWLAQRPQVMLNDLGPRPIREYRLYVTDTQERALALLFLAGLPGGALALGALVWLRRRT